MASTFSPILRIELIGTGDQSGTWGNTTNINLGSLIEQSIAGTAEIDVTLGNVTLTSFNGATDEARCMVLNIEGSPGTSRNVIAPATSKTYVVINSSDSTVVLKTSTSTGLSIPASAVYLATYDTVTLDFKLVGKASATANTPSTLVERDSSGNFSAGTITANLTGNLTGNVTGNLTGNLVAAAPTAPTQAYGTNNTTIASTAFVQAALQALHPVGSIYIAVVSTNPATLFGFGTWVEFGRGRTLVGLDPGDGVFDTVEETGGNKDAVLVSHTHTATVTDPGHNHQACISNFGQGTGGPGGSGSSSYGTNCGNVTGTSATGITVANSTEGVSGANKNLQPYIVVYMWKRTA